MKFKIIKSLLFALALQPAWSMSNIPCSLDPTRQEARKDEIHQLYLSDQDDRADIFPADVISRDRKRRMRIGEILAEGCIYQGQSYYESAIIFQHGEIPDHFFLAIYLATQAKRLNYTGASWLQTAAVDRYLVSIGHKQLFATQFFVKSPKTNPCMCMQPVEQSFPDGERKLLSGRSLDEWFVSMDKQNKQQGQSNCPVTYCDTQLKPSPKGTVPGF